MNARIAVFMLALGLTSGCNSSSEESASKEISVADASNEGSPSTRFWEAVAATPETLIKHGVDLKGYFDEQKAPVSTPGPELVLKSVNVEGHTSEVEIAYLSWYRITKGESESHGEVTLQDALAGESYKVRVGSPAYLLSPSKHLTDGPPAEIPAGLNYFKVYRIDGGLPLDESVSLKDAFGFEGEEPRRRQVVKASFLCLPAEEWHHDEYFGIEDANSCFVVYSLEANPLEIDTTTNDQFGIHKLQLSSSNWLCVSASIGE